MRAALYAGNSTGWKQPEEVIVMFCFRTRKLLVPYAEGSLGSKAADAVAKHLSRCSRCSDELAAVQQACRVLRSAKTPAPEPALDLWARIEREIAAPAPVRTRAWQMKGLQFGGAAAAAAIVLFAVVGTGKLGEIVRPAAEIRSPKPGLMASGPNKKATPAERPTVGSRTPSDRPVLPLHRPASPKVPVTLAFADGNNAVGSEPSVRLDDSPRWDWSGASPSAEPAAPPTPETGSDGVISDGWEKKDTPSTDIADFSADNADDSIAYRNVLRSEVLRHSESEKRVFAYSVVPTSPSDGGRWWSRNGTDSSSEVAGTIGSAAGVDYAAGHVVAAAPVALDRSAVTTAADDADSGTTHTSVDMLNDADTDTRTAALFLYP
jgi:hypothetical protein